MFVASLPWYEPVHQRIECPCRRACSWRLLLPVIGIAILLIKLTSRGPAFYLQTRLGRYGQLYTIYKLRTMVNNCERYSGTCWAKTNDPRVTSHWLGSAQASHRRVTPALECAQR